MVYGLWVMGYGLWVMGYGLWVKREEGRGKREEFKVQEFKGSRVQGSKSKVKVKGQSQCQCQSQRSKSIVKVNSQSQKQGICSSQENDQRLTANSQQLTANCRFADFRKGTLFAVGFAGGAEVAAVEEEPVVGAGDVFLGEMLNQFFFNGFRGFGAFGDQS